MPRNFVVIGDATKPLDIYAINRSSAAKKASITSGRLEIRWSLAFSLTWWCRSRSMFRSPRHTALPRPLGLGRRESFQPLIHRRPSPTRSQHRCGTARRAYVRRRTSSFQLLTGDRKEESKVSGERVRVWLRQLTEFSRFPFAAYTSAPRCKVSRVLLAPANVEMSIAWLECANCSEHLRVSQNLRRNFIITWKASLRLWMQRASGMSSRLAAS